MLVYGIWLSEVVIDSLAGLLIELNRHMEGQPDPGAPPPRRYCTPAAISATQEGTFQS